MSKYKKPARQQDEEKQDEDELAKKRQVKEKQRLMGRVIPTEDGAEHERELQIIATKGVIQLFQAVTDFQTT